MKKSQCPCCWCSRSCSRRCCVSTGQRLGLLGGLRSVEAQLSLTDRQGLSCAVCVLCMARVIVCHLLSGCAATWLQFACSRLLSWLLGSSVCLLRMNPAVCIWNAELQGLPRVHSKNAQRHLTAGCLPVSTHVPVARRMLDVNRPCCFLNKTEGTARAHHQVLSRAAVPAQTPSTSITAPLCLGRLFNQQGWVQLIHRRLQTPALHMRTLYV